jgi:signal transduction histidine kinase
MVPLNIMNVTANSFEKSANLDSALTYYKHALELINRCTPLFPDKKAFIEGGTAVIYGRIGKVYLLLNKNEEASRYLKESILINTREGHDDSEVQNTKLTLAELSIRLGHFLQAAQLLTDVNAYLAATDSTYPSRNIVRSEWYRLKWQYYDQTHTMDSAYSYYRQYDSIRDSTSRVNQLLSHEDMDNAFKGIKQQYKLELLEKSNQLKTILLLVIVVFSFMAVAILLIVWYSLKRSRKHVNVLTGLNQEIHEQNTRMQEALTALEQSQEDNTRMMRIVAHDLRNPIGGITMFADIMLQEWEHSNDNRMMLEMIKTSGQNSLELVSDLLTVHTKAGELRMESTDITSMLHYCVNLLQHKAEAKGQRIYLQTIPVCIPANREKLWRVVSNLISNAIKFSPSGATIHVDLQKNDPGIRITVRDNGIGIPEKIKDKVFDMFTEAKRPGTADEQPFGLGLAISKQIVEAHGGRIWFDSKPGNGTTFYVELPINEPDALA